MISSTNFQTLLQTLNFKQEGYIYTKRFADWFGAL